MKRDNTQYRSRQRECTLETRKKQGSEDMVIEGYFALCNSETELWTGAFEEIASGAFDNTLDNDIRALINHDSTMVLGRTKAGTLTLRADDKGLWGSILVNPKDADAVNLYERVKRGDVTSCSFGFCIKSENVDFREDDSVKWTITEADVHEVSVVTFPAYEETEVEARKRDFESISKRKLEERKIKLREKVKQWQSDN